MKTIALLLSLIFASYSMAAPPLGISGQGDTSNKYPAVHKVPNFQLTDIGSSQGLVETGNNNILKDGSFEALTLDPAWVTGGTATVGSSGSTLHGSKKLCFTADSGGETFTLVQDSTLYQSEFADGVNGRAFLRIESTHDEDITICTRKAGAVTLDCKVLDSSYRDGLWKAITIPTVLGGTSNGISISGASGEGVTCFDEMIVEAGDFTGEAELTTNDNLYTATFTGFGTVSPATNQCNYRESGGRVEIQCTFVSGNPTGVEARVSLPSNYLVKSGLPTRFKVGTWTRSSTGASSFTVLAEPGAGYITVGVQSSGAAGYTKALANAFAANGETHSFYASIPIQGLSASVNTYTERCQSDLQCENHFTLKGSAAGVVTDPNVSGWVSSCTDATPFVCSLNTTVFTEAPNCGCNLEETGSGECNSVTTATTVSVYTKNSGGTNAKQKFILWCDKSDADTKVRREIVGSFKEVPKTPGINQFKTCILQFGGADENTACASSPCTEFYDSCGIFTTPTRGSAGSYPTTAPAGTCKNNGRAFLDVQAHTASGTAQGRKSLFFKGDPARTYLKASATGALDLIIQTENSAAANADAIVNVKMECESP